MEEFTPSSSGKPEQFAFPYSLAHTSGPPGDMVAFRQSLMSEHSLELPSNGSSRQRRNADANIVRIASAGLSESGK